MSMQHVSSESSSVTTEIISTSDLGTVSAVETVETTTTTTTSTKSTIRITPSPDRDIVKTIEPGLVTARKSEDSKTDLQGSQNGMVSSGSETPEKPKDNKIIVVGSEAKPGSGLMNIQSVCPANKPGTTFVLLNKEGNQMKISLASKKDENTDDSRADGENSNQCKLICKRCLNVIALSVIKLYVYIILFA